MKQFMLRLGFVIVMFVAACMPQSRLQSPLASPAASPLITPGPSSMVLLSPLPTTLAELRSTSMSTPWPSMAPTAEHHYRAGTVYHVIRAGDTVQSIALEYNVPIKQIYQLNGLTPSSLLRIGQELIIIDPTATLVLLPTPTPPPSPTPTSLPTIIPPIQSASADQLPHLTRDLLFVRNDELMLWHHDTNQFEVLAGPPTGGDSSSIQPVSLRLGPGAPVGSVTGFSVSDDGRKIAYTQFGGVINSVETYTVTLLDLDTRHTVVLLRDGIEQPLDWNSISPDGQGYAYLAAESLSTSSRHAGLAALPLGGGRQAATIKVIRIAAPDQPIQIGRCTDESTQEVRLPCRGFLWSPDSRAIAWADGRGIWMAKLGGQPRQLATSTLTMPGGDPHGIYSLSQWSPSGRYLLIHISHYEGGTTGVLDAQTGSISTVLNSFEYAYPGPNFVWLNDDRLLVARPAVAFGGTTPSIEIWRFDTANPLTYTQSSVMPVGAGNFPAIPVVLEDGRIGLVLMNTSNSNYTDRGVYFVDVNDLSSHKVNGIPPLGRADDLVFPVTAVWSPDGSGVIIQDWERNLLLYVPTDGTSPYDLRPVMGDNVCCFTWLRR